MCPCPVSLILVPTTSPSSPPTSVASPSCSTPIGLLARLRLQSWPSPVFSHSSRITPLGSTSRASPPATSTAIWILATRYGSLSFFFLVISRYGPCMNLPSLLSVWQRAIWLFAPRPTFLHLRLFVIQSRYLRLEGVGFFISICATGRKRFSTDPLWLAHFSSSSLRSTRRPFGKIKCRSPSCVSTSSPEPTYLHPGCEQFLHGLTLTTGAIGGVGAAVGSCTLGFLLCGSSGACPVGA